jgi:hypothetical protein
MTGPGTPGNQTLLNGAFDGLGLLAIEPQTASATGQVVAGECLFVGFSFAETTSAASATVDVFDGSNTGGQKIIRVTLDPGQSRSDDLPRPGVHCEVGLFVNVVAGTIDGEVWVVPS